MSTAIEILVEYQLRCDALARELRATKADLAAVEAERDRLRVDLEKFTRAHLGRTL